MAPSLQELIARRSELKAELALVEAAIAAFADATPVEVATRRNNRNTGGVSTNMEYAEDMLVIFADETLTTPAGSADHGGWVVKSAWESYKLDKPGYQDWIWEVQSW